MNQDINFKCDDYTFSIRTVGVTVRNGKVLLQREKDGNEYALSLDKCGYSKDEIETACYTDMYEYYSQEQIEKYGVLGIELCDISFSKNCT